MRLFAEKFKLCRFVCCCNYRLLLREGPTLRVKFPLTGFIEINSLSKVLLENGDCLYLVSFLNEDHYFVRVKFQRLMCIFSLVGVLRS